MNKKIYITTSNKFKELDIHAKRTLGSILYGKLIIEEYLNTLPESATSGKPYLDNIKNILAEICDSATTNIDKNISDLITNINELLKLKPKEFHDKTQAKALFISLYTTLTLVDTYANNLGWKYYVAKTIVTNFDGKLKNIKDIQYTYLKGLNQINLSFK